MRVSADPDNQRWFIDPLALVRRSDWGRSRKQTFHCVLRRRRFHRPAAYAGTPSFRGEMDLARWPDRVSHRLAERLMASATALAYVRAVDEYCSQRQKRRAEPAPIHPAADCFHESGNASVMALRSLLG